MFGRATITLGIGPHSSCFLCSNTTFFFFIGKYFTLVHTLFSLSYTVLLPAALRAAQICRYLVYSEANFEVFRPAGATRCTDGGEICDVTRYKQQMDMTKTHEVALPRLIRHVADAGLVVVVTPSVLHSAEQCPRAAPVYRSACPAGQLAQQVIHH